MHVYMYTYIHTHTYMHVTTINVKGHEFDKEHSGIHVRVCREEGGDINDIIKLYYQQ